MRDQARGLANAIKKGAQDEVDRSGPSQRVGIITSFRSPKNFALDVQGEDFELNEDDVTLSQQVRQYHADKRLRVGDGLVLVEHEPGEFMAVAVDSDEPVKPTPSPGTGIVTVVAVRDSPLPASTYDNGEAGVGATLTADANGALPAIDGVTPYVGMRVLIQDQ